ncbi:MAG: acyl-CoA dehydrogenase family protein [Actinomycetota bacterium]|nr:acyl-CoA dehydrogenase family protein [Actinomycetota bacterium]
MRAPIDVVTEAGAAAVAAAETVAEELAPGAGERDRRAVADPEVGRLLARRLGGLTTPVDLGGGGVDRLVDLMVVAERVARADGSASLLTTMHLSATWGLSRRWAATSGTVADPDDPLGRLLAGATDGDVWICAAVTEPGTNFFHPTTVLRPDGDGWVLDGSKAFATGSPVATHLLTHARGEGGDHDGRLVTVVVPVGAPGVAVHDDWDGLGMRSSGSGRVTLEDVRLDGGTIVLGGGPVGAFSAGALCGRAFGNVANLAAMAGLAEAGRDLAVGHVRRAGRVGEVSLAARAPVRQAVGELDVELGVCRAALAAIGDEADEVADGGALDLDGAHAFMASFQAAKLTVNRSSVDVVDRAMHLAGGGSYTAGHPLARIYRDVRAGAYMQPFSAHEAAAYIGAVATGVDPDVRA